MKRLINILVLAAVLLGACAPRAADAELILATTTSTQDSGLLDVLIPLFEEQTGYVVQVVAVGTGQALKMGEQGNADVLLVHAPGAEIAFMQAGFGADRRLVMHNDFIIVGPAHDPAGVSGMTDIEQALVLIFASGATFVSRGDDSGTHKMESSLWAAAGLDPAGQTWYLESGQGMGATLNIAFEKDGYTLTDRGTFLAYRNSVGLSAMVEDDPKLLNAYHVITVNPELWPLVNAAGATAFADFLVSAEAQALVANFGVEQFGQPLFFPDAGRTDTELGLP